MSVCVEISLTNMSFSGIEQAFGSLPSFSIPSMPIIPDPIYGDQLDPLAEKFEKYASVAMSVIMKYFKEFILDPIEPLVDAFKAIVAAAGALWDEVINFEIPQLGVKFMDFINDLIARGSAAIQTLVDQIKDKVDMITAIQLPNPLIPDVKNPIYEAVQKVQALIKESALAVYKKCLDIIAMVVEKVNLVGQIGLIGVTVIGEKIQGMLDMIAQMPQLINQGWTAVLGMFGGIAVDPTQLAKQLANDIAAKAKDAEEKASRIVDEASAAAAKAANEAVEQAKAAAEAALAPVMALKAQIEGMISQMSMLFGAIPVPGLPDIAKLVGEKEEHFYKQLSTFVQSWWASATSAMMNVFTEAIGELKSKVDQILAIVNSLPTDPALQQIAINAINAITAGLFGFLQQLPTMLANLMEGKCTFCVDVPTIPQIA